jgi:protease-4
VARFVALAATMLWAPLVRASDPGFFDPMPRLSSYIPRSSVATTEGALATVLNPAALDARPEPDFTYLRTVKGATAKDDAFFLSLYGLGVGFEYGSTPFGGRRIGYRKTTLSGGSAVVKGLYWGTTRSSYASKESAAYDDLAVWDVGVLTRRRWSALGVVARNVNRPKFDGNRLERAFDFGYALRPGTDRITLAFDFRKRDDESFRAAWNRHRYFGSVEVEPLDGFRFAGNAYGDGQFEVRAMLSFDHFGFGNGSRLDRGGHAAQVALVNAHQGSSPNVLYRRQYAVVVTPDEWRSTYWDARRDPRVRGVVVKLDGERMALAEWQEFRSQLAELKSKGLQIGAYIHSTGTSGYWLASVADTVLADPIAEIELVGLRSDTLYYRRALDRLGVQTQFERVGEFKSGTEPYTQDAPSEPVSQNLDALLDDLYGQLVSDMATSRGESDDSVRNLIDAGPYLGEATVDAGLVDDTATPDDAEDALQEQFGKAQLVTAAEYLRNRRRPRDWSPRPDRLAVVRVDGIMVDGESAYDPLTGTHLSGAETVGAAIESAASDRRVKGIVLDIESGGGLVTASEALWRTIQSAREAKPVVARIGGIGASGAYYIASGANWIVAEPSSVTGSIGVYSGRISLKDSFSKLGVTTSSSQRGANADYYAEYGELRDTHREILREQVQSFYDVFLNRVSEGRQMTVAEVDAVARGQVWTGRQALERRLVDELGGMSEAIRAAKRLAKVPEDRLLEVEILPKPTLAERLAGWGIAHRLRTPLEWGSPGSSAMLTALRRARVFAWLPWTVSD